MYNNYLGRMDMGGTQANPQAQQQAMIQQVAQALQKAKPEDVVKALIAKGLDAEQAKGIVSAVMQQMSGGGAEEEQMQQASAQPPMMAAQGMEVGDGPGDLWNNLVSGVSNAYNTGKKYVSNAIDKVTHTDPVNFIPYGSNLPANVKAIGRMAATKIGLGQGVPFVQKGDFTPAQINSMKTATNNYKKRQAASTKKIGMNYSDYNTAATGKQKVWSKNPIDMVTMPNKVVQTTLGRFSPQVNQNDIQINDHYDFQNEGGQNFLSNILMQFDKILPQDDPRRNISFNITNTDSRKNGGLFRAKDGSIVNYLSSRGEDYSKEARKRMAAERGIKNYDFSAGKNLELLRALQSEEGSSQTPTRKTTPTGKTPDVKTASVAGRLGYNPSNNKINVGTSSEKTTVKSASPTMTEGQRNASMIKAADAYTPSWQKKGASANLPDKKNAKKDSKKKASLYVDLQKEYGLDPFSKEGILKAKEIGLQNPNTRFICTAAGCSEIAVNAADAFGQNFNKGNAWDLGNSNRVVATNPIYANQIGKGILSDPTNYSAPANMFQPNSIIALNRTNTRKGGMATTRADANDSYDYANQKLYPGSRGNEHVGYMLDGRTMLHGTGGHDGQPAYYMIDANMSNGVSLPGNLNYQPVETITPGGIMGQASNFLGSLFRQEGGDVRNRPYSGTYSNGVYYGEGGAYGGPILQNYMKETSPMYNFGGYFPQGPRFEDGGGYDNEGFRALPPMVQQKILRQRMYGGTYADGGTTMDGTQMGMIDVYREGGININPSKRGTFTAAATKHGKSVQGFANQVLSNKDNYSPAMVKKANFARNAAKWKGEDGGIVVGQTYDASPEMLQKLQAGGYKFEYVD
jgi:hypothetical protein